ncbi:enoyl-CoA hydratase-related protein [Curtobacterium sp. NPDC090217]|uniref:enoyl-CoA hydratase-related protein n=1 Tax=Curtobacterium sp. NPDC090217 TaxID=3363970 RepID=UPI0038182435
MTDSNRTFQTTQHGAVTEIQFYGSGIGNVLGAAFWAELQSALERVGADDATSAIVLHGTHEDFSAGLDLRWYYSSLRRRARSTDPRREALASEESFQSAVSAISACPLPVIAAVTGKCRGIAVELAAACDIRIASAEAVFALPEVALGLYPDLGATYRLPRLIGDGWARQLMLSGKAIDATTAARIGLVNDVYPDPQMLFQAAIDLAANVASNPRSAVIGVKQILNAVRDEPLPGVLRNAALHSAAMLPDGLDSRIREVITNGDELS